jgi:hypothetical protein
MAAAVCFLAAFGFFLAGASPTVSFEDTGELLLSASVLGVTHPPGYPWLTMVMRLFMALPFGDPAFRVNAMSAAAGAGAVTAAFTLARALTLTPSLSHTVGEGVGGKAAPWVAAVALAASKTLWWQAGIADKYTWSVLLMLLTLLALVRAWRDRSPGALFSAAFLGGLALSHHLHGLYLVPAVVAAAWGSPTGPRARRIIMCLFLSSLPLMAKAVAIPIRSAADPAMNWGLPDRAGRLAYYLAARQYRFIMGSNKGAGDIAARIVRHVTVLPLAELGPVVGLAVPGLLVLRAAGPGLLPGAGLLFATNLFFGVYYNTPEIERYYLLSYALLAILIGLGGMRLLAASRVFGVAAVCLLAVPLVVNGRTAPRDRHYLAWDFAVNQLAPLPARAMLICEGDDQAFPMFYAQGVLGLRPDVTLFPMPFACWEPAYKRLPRTLPGFRWPAFVENPGVHLPRIMVANADRPAFYTPGCSGEGSADHLVPRGTVFAAFVDPKAASAARGQSVRFPALRLRGAADAGRYGDAVTVRAVRNYATALAYHGAEALERGRPEEAVRFLRAALRIPILEGTHAAALTHLGMSYATLRRFGEAEAGLREALRVRPDFGPAAFELARLLIVLRRPVNEIRELIMIAARHQEFLSEGERRDLARVVRLRR